MNDTPENPDARAALRAIAVQIEQWRTARGMSKSALMREISGLNDKTYNKILREDWDGLTPGNHLDRYSAALRECQRFDLRVGKEQIMADLPPTAVVYAALCGLRLNSGNDRFLLILSEGGGGKTEALRHAEQHIDGAVYVCGGATWSSPRHAVADILTALGVPENDIPVSFADRTDMLISRLNIKPALLLIDEYHEAAPLMHNVLKLVINRTRAWVAVAAASSIWNDNAAKSWAILRQMVHNRMDLRVSLPPPTAGDVEDYLVARLGINPPREKTPDAPAWDGAFKGIASTARNNGLWAYVRKVAKAAGLAASLSEGKKIGPSDLTNAAAAVLKNTAGLSHRLNCYVGDESTAHTPG